MMIDYVLLLKNKNKMKRESPILSRYKLAEDQAKTLNTYKSWLKWKHEYC